jgi:hypothetical protein
MIVLRRPGCAWDLTKVPDEHVTLRCADCGSWPAKAKILIRYLNYSNIRIVRSTHPRWLAMPAVEDVPEDARLAITRSGKIPSP